MNLKRVFYSLVMVSLIFTISCKNDTKVQEEVVKLVKVEMISDQQNVEYLSFNGKVKEKSLTLLSFRVGGPLVSVNVNAGDYVNSGDLIAQIDKRDYQIQLDNAKAQYFQIKGEYERYKELYNKDKIPANTYEKIESGYLMAKAGYENATNQLNDTELKAPISGYIHEKMVENFNTVGPGQPIFSIIDMSELEVIISVPENHVLEMKSCQENYLSVKNADVFEIPIKLKSVNEKTGKDGMYEVRFIMKNKDNYNIYPGMSAEVKVVCEGTGNEIYLSSDVVFMDNNKTCVWVYNPVKQLVRKQEVVLASLHPGGELEIIKGLKAGDFIVTAGVHSLSDAQKVRPIKMGSASNVGGLL
ncbi:MAG: efflux RND transporter periplasmic adaptor subunit [Bacteroidales bacterium]|nr:efflux RND transporter periplasmic adaptor subunit [Bacteroidales bacterium]